MTLISIDTDVRDEVKPLFGTVTNAARCLRLVHIPYPHLNSALKGMPVNADYADVLIDHWRQWKQYHLNSYLMSLPAEERNLTWELPPDFDLTEHRAAEETFWVTKLAHRDKVQSRDCCSVCGNAR